MHIIKRIALLITAGIFRVLLITAAVTGAIVLTLGNPSHLKNILKDSGVYDNVVSNVLTQSQKSAQKNGSDIPLNNKDVKLAATKAFNPQFLQSSTENVIDGFYRWLDGKANQPDFKIDLTVPKKQFIAGLAEAAGKQVNKLPVCSSAQISTASKDFDPFTAKCKPAGISAKTQKQKIIHDMSTSKDFLKDPVITAKDLKNDQKQPIFSSDSNTQNVPNVYGWAKMSPTILFVVMGALGLATVFLHDTKHKGVKRLGIAVLTAGVLLILGSLVTQNIIKSVLKPSGALGKSLNGNTFASSIIKAITAFSQLLNKNVFIYGVVYCLIGTALLVAMRFIKPTKAASKNE